MTPATKLPIDQIVKLHELGQSLWLDNIRRELITSGELARLRDSGVTGVTSNPTIFEKAVSGSTDYDEALAQLVQQGLKPKEILWELMVADIQMAADVFRPVYNDTGGADGYVSIEVSPDVADSPERTIAMAEDLRQRCNRPNVMVKIPATKAGIPAIRDQIAKGHNINVTLIFSVDRYLEVVEAFISGLEELRRRGGDLDRVASVASFFVSRVDTKVDRLLQARIDSAHELKEKESLASLLGKAGIANSKVAYQHFQELHSGPRWESLAKAGARVQRCLWASTSVKDSRYADTMYVDELIGPNTINTVPNRTLEAFVDHGNVRRTVDKHLDSANRHLEELAKLGIDLDGVTSELEVEGVEAFEKSYESLTQVLGQAAHALQTGQPAGKTGSKGRL